MSYLRLYDYSSIIQQENLTVIQGNNKIRQESEATAIEEVSSYLRHRYATELIFKDVLPFRAVTRTTPGTYSPASTYALSERVAYGNNIYKCTTIITVPEAWNASHWLKLVSEEQFIPGDLVEYTEPVFSVTKAYEISDRVVYAGNIYKCIAPVTATAWNSVKWTLICAENTLYYVTQSVFNQYPDEWQATYTEQSYLRNLNEISGWDVSSKILYLKKKAVGTIVIYPTAADSTNETNAITTITFDESGIEYPIAVTVSPSSTLSGWCSVVNFITTGTEWTIEMTKAYIEGDNRNAKIKTCVMDVALNELHKRINPRNIPELRVKAYDDAVSWLNKVAKGLIMVDLPLRANKEDGQNIEFGNDTPAY